MQGFDLDFIVYIKTLWERFLEIFKLSVDCIKSSRLGLGILFGSLAEELQISANVLCDRGRPWSPRGKTSARVVEKLPEGRVLPVSWLTHLFNVTWTYKTVSVKWHTVVVVVVSILKRGTWGCALGYCTFQPQNRGLCLILEPWIWVEQWGLCLGR